LQQQDNNFFAILIVNKLLVNSKTKYTKYTVKDKKKTKTKYEKIYSSSLGTESESKNFQLEIRRFTCIDLANRGCL